jgi:preprotein translocase subunit YajC
VSDTLGALLPLLLLALAFVVLVVLPMRARSRMTQQVRQMQASLTVGTEIMTTSGVYGRIVALDEQTADVEIAPGIVVRWARAAIGEVRRPAEDTTDEEGAGGSGGSAARPPGEQQTGE